MFFGWFDAIFSFIFPILFLLFRIPVVPMPEMCPVRTDTTPARSRHTM